MQPIDRYREQARETLTARALDYFEGGAGDERTIGDNESAWADLWLRPRVLVDVDLVDCSIELLGSRLSMPVILAPVALQRLAHPDGELATARAAARAGTVHCLSSRATADLREVAEAADGARWFQLYVERDRALTEEVLRRAAAAGYERVVLTADFAVTPRREREEHHGEWQLPDGVTVATHLGRPRAPDDRLMGGWDATLSWRDLGWVAETSGLPVIVKGILTAEDAALAVEHGAQAVVVSNHGGRQLEGAVPSAVALPEVVEEVGDRVPVLVDGGIRSGTDVFRALALGAEAVLVGRPYLWGLAAAGEEGVLAVLDALREDLRRTMALAGCPSVQAVTPAHVRPRAEPGSLRAGP